MPEIPEVEDRSEVPAQGGPSDEVARLRAEVVHLREELAHAHEPQGPAASPPTGRTGWWRTAVVAVCITVAALLAPLSVLAVWAHDQVGSTDRYLATVSPLAEDPVVQDAIINRVTTEIVTRLDVTAVTQEAVDALAERGLPPRVAASLTALSGPLANGVTSFVRDQVAKIVHSPTFADAWTEANRQAHTQLVALLTGKDSSTVEVTGDAVQINLAAVIETVKQALVDKGFSLAGRLPTVNAQFTLVQSNDLAKAQRGFSLLSALARGLPVVGLVLLAVAVYLAKSRRRALMASGLAVAAGLLLLGATLNLVRPVYLSAVPSDQIPQAAAAAVYDQVVSFIRLSLRAVLVVALAVALGAWLAGTSGSALAVRRGIVRATAAVRHGGEHVGLDTGPFGAWLFRYRALLRGVVIGIALLLYVAADHPTGSWTLRLLVVTVAVLLVLEVLARPPRADASAAGGAPPVAPA